MGEQGVDRAKTAAVAATQGPHTVCDAPRRFDPCPPSRLPLFSPMQWCGGTHVPPRQCADAPPGQPKGPQNRCITSRSSLLCRDGRCPRTTSWSEHREQADFPAEQSPPRQEARFPPSHADPCGPWHPLDPSRQGPQGTLGLIWCGVLAPPLRRRRSHAAPRTPCARWP